MPLDLLLALVAGGISAIAALLHLAGCSRQMVLGPETARATWLRHFPQDPPARVLPAASGQAALVLTGSGAGLLWAFGAGTAGRHLSGCRIRETATGLRFDFNDFAAPGLSLTLPEGERRAWLARIATAAEAA
ncbi:hypothetical protein [Leisingera thetidis]|uniref:hypothetical protein n=1 Tax=Leisingera thetidis TaxID=2930199 RepID=UPI0021F6F768|nr:hypothetical protein [Leisingera thetidis]